MLVHLARRAAVLALAVGLAVSAFGCSGTDSSSDGATGQSEDALDANEKPAFDFFVGKGLTTFQAAGIVGNLVQESNVDPTAVQSGGPGRGIAQWSTGGRWDSDANDNAVAYAAKQKESVESLNLQLEFIWYELSTFGYGLSALRATTNVTDAEFAFQRDFEVCGTCDQTNRLTYAKAALAAYGAIPYGATYVDQSFPLATATLKMKAGEVIPSYITLKNSGTKPWDSNTRLGTTQPRDRVSAFADSTWVSPSRASEVSGTVAPGGTFKFEFDLKAPAKVGKYDEFFGVVQEGVAWFGDPGQGGPVDSNIEVKIQVVPADGTDGGVDDSDDGGTVIGPDGGVEPQSGAPSTDDPANGDTQNGSNGGGCSVSSGRAGHEDHKGHEKDSQGLFMIVGLGVAILARGSRRRVSAGVIESARN
ncbi:MAG: phage tail tip lysozyme [Polyangiaceae bacterium]